MDLEAFRAAWLGDPLDSPGLIAAFERAWRVPAARGLEDALVNAVRRHNAREGGAALMASVRDAERRLEEIAAAPGRRGVWAHDGTPVSAEFKRSVFERWERARDERRSQAAGRQAVFASASPDGGPSPMLRAIYGLD
jgi:hypothetical protein